MAAALEIVDLRKQFPTGPAAVDNVGFDVAVGEIVVLLGPSGCGKTTTLRCVAGLERPTSGAISIAGNLVSCPERGVMVAPRHRDIGMVFQSYAVWPHMTVRQNVAYPLKHRRLKGADMQAKVDEALALVGLGEYAERSVVQLSGGQMQRVALARSLVYRPQLLLLDEPLSNLDAKLRIRLRDDLRRILKATGMTGLYVTHDQAEAVVLGDRIGVMRGGKVLQMAPPDEIYNRPSDLFVANFTGASNLIAGKLVGQDGADAVIEVKDGAKLRAWMPKRLGAGDAVSVAIRPENVSVGMTNGVANSFPARIRERRYQGVQTIYDVELLGTLVQAIELGTAARHDVGAAVTVTLPPQACWAYREESAAAME